MDGGLVVGTGVMHPRYGKGDVAGFSAGRKTVRVKFAGAGFRDLTYPCAELVVVPPAVGGEEEKSLTLGFDGKKDHGPGCRWLMQFTGAPMLTLVYDINTWANSKAKIEGAAVNLTSLERGRMELRITGQGKDGRCRWCRTFRSGLRTAVRRDYGPQAFVLAGRCVFDGSPEAPGAAARPAGTVQRGGTVVPHES